MSKLHLANYERINHWAFQSTIQRWANLIGEVGVGASKAACIRSCIKEQACSFASRFPSAARLNMHASTAMRWTAHTQELRWAQLPAVQAMSTVILCLKDGDAEHHPVTRPNQITQETPKRMGTEVEVLAEEAIHTGSQWWRWRSKDKTQVSQGSSSTTTINSSEPARSGEPHGLSLL